MFGSYLKKNTFYLKIKKNLMQEKIEYTIR